LTARPAPGGRSQIARRRLAAALEVHFVSARGANELLAARQPSRPSSACPARARQWVVGRRVLETRGYRGQTLGLDIVVRAFSLAYQPLQVMRQCAPSARLAGKSAASGCDGCVPHVLPPLTWWIAPLRCPKSPVYLTVGASPSWLHICAEYIMHTEYRLLVFQLGDSRANVVRAAWC
jgi:hypothetical protein